VGGEERRLNGKVDGPPRDVGTVVGKYVATYESTFAS